MQTTEDKMVIKVPCTLCGLNVPQSKVITGKDSFCCSGCDMVYKILKEKGKESSYKESALFKEAIKHGIISNPILVKQESTPKNEETYKVYLEIEGLFCPACAKVISLILNRKKGVVRCDVDYSTDLAILEYQPRYISREILTDTISRLGYQARFLDSEEKEKKGRPLLASMGISFFCSMNIMTLTSLIYAEARHGSPTAFIYALWSGVFYLPILLYSAYPFYKIFFKRLFIGYFGMETLISISVLTGSFYSFWNLFRGSHEVYFDSLSMIVSLVLYGKHLEWKAKSNSKLALLSLHKTLPKKARKVSASGQLEEVYVKDIQENDELVASVGEKIIADGIVLKGEGLMDESLLTGEALPKHKKKGSQLIAGSHLTTGSLYYKVLKKPSQSTLSKILLYIENELGKNIKKTRFVDKVTQFFVPAIVIISCTVGATLMITGSSFQIAFDRMLSILLISCPCAIGIASPLAESLARKALSLKGILVKSKEVLSTDHSSSIWVYDKTGTITEGSFQVTRGLDALSENNKKILKTLSSFSKHPLSKSLTLTLKSIDILEAEHLEEEIGRGVHGVISNKPYFLGSFDYMCSLGLNPQIPPSDTQVATYLYFATTENILASLTLEDEIKKEAPEILKKIPSKEVIILSGDRDALVQAIAKKCQVKRAYGEKNPLEKQEMIKKLRENNHIVFVGDGINDAPAIAAANTGIAIYSAQDISLQVADVILTEDHMSSLPLLPRVIEKTRKIAFQNVFWSFFYNTIGVLLATFGYLKPIYAAFFMVISSLVVILNSLRLKKT